MQCFPNMYIDMLYYPVQHTPTYRGTYMLIKTFGPSPHLTGKLVLTISNVRLIWPDSFNIVYLAKSSGKPI